jgi:isocitrate dehydrogenase
VRSLEKKELVGVDVYLEWRDGTADALGAAVQKVNGDGLELKRITNRGAKVWPEGLPETFCTDHWRCRFQPAQGNAQVSYSQIVGLLQRFADASFDVIKTDNLYTFDGKPAYSSIQGE